MANKQTKEINSVTLKSQGEIPANSPGLLKFLKLAILDFDYDVE
jgi:hypothetical protein